MCVCVCVCACVCCLYHNFLKIIQDYMFFIETGPCMLFYSNKNV